MKIEHIIYVLAKRIINFHLFLQNICDVEVWTQKKKKNPHKKNQLWTRGHISGSRMNFEPKSILGGTLGCREPRKTGILMAQGSPLGRKIPQTWYTFCGPGTVPLVFKGFHGWLGSNWEA